jgi:hypothetical protein
MVAFIDFLEGDQSPEAVTLRIIRDNTLGAKNVALAAWQNGYAQLWHNPLGLTPQQVLDLLGTNAQESFQQSYYIGQWLISLGCDIVNDVPAGVTYTANADGSITLTS